MAAKTMLTIEDFERLPSEIVKNHELVDGELVDVSGNTPIHNILKGRLFSVLFKWAKDYRAGTVLEEQEYDFLGNAHGPDISFFEPEKRQLLHLHKRVQRFVPDLAVEIASESDSYSAMLRKKDRYLRAGTREVWLISTSSAEIMIYRGAGARILQAGDTLTSELLAGFGVALDELFSGLNHPNEA
jgi:Uma2 family endonuclease